MTLRVPVSFVMRDATSERVDELRERISRRICGIRITRAEMLRLLIERGLSVLEDEEHYRLPLYREP